MKLSVDLHCFGIKRHIPLSLTSVATDNFPCHARYQYLPIRRSILSTSGRHRSSLEKRRNKEASFRTSGNCLSPHAAGLPPLQREFRGASSRSGYILNRPGGDKMDSKTRFTRRRRRRGKKVKRK